MFDDATAEWPARVVRAFSNEAVSNGAFLGVPWYAR